MMYRADISIALKKQNDAKRWKKWFCSLHCYCHTFFPKVFVLSVYVSHCYCQLTCAKGYLAKFDKKAQRVEKVSM